MLVDLSIEPTISRDHQLGFHSAGKMSLRYGLGSAGTALAVVGACKMRFFGSNA